MAAMKASTAGFGLAHQEMYRVANLPDERGIVNILKAELSQLDGVSGHNPDTGIPATKAGQFLGKYTNKLFGSPFQLLDSVDRRFEELNDRVGNEYLRNFLLNSPILHIRPGLPIYTGGSSLVRDTLKDMFITKDVGKSIMMGLAKSTIFKSGQVLQRRMFSFRETYMDYMSNVNYMCRSVATYMGIDKMGTFVPGSSSGTGVNTMTPFAEIRWENYRMLNTYVRTTSQQIAAMIQSNVATQAAGSFGSFIKGLWNDIDELNRQMANLDAAGDDINMGTGKSMRDELSAKYSLKLEEASKAVDSSWDDVNVNSSTLSVIDNKVKSLMIMVEPTTFNESLTNSTKTSMLASAIDGIDQGIGSEIAFITGAHADTGAIGSLIDFMGGAMSNLAGTLSKLTEGATGGFTTNLFSGAMGALKGQRMIYPEIYERSNSSMNRDFTTTFSTPYGDKYNYYMEVAVPTLHMLALGSPRMISANTTTSPYIVQAYIPGMMTCQMGIIESMVIKKNPSEKHVSVHGYPLTVKVDFTIKELYNSLAISPANDPASFMFNETLNDYLVNMSGLIPSMTAIREKREAAWANISHYFTDELWNDATSGVLESWENMFSNYG